MNKILKLGIKNKLEVWIYKLRKESRCFHFTMCEIDKMIEISLWYVNILIIWGIKI